MSKILPDAFLSRISPADRKTMGKAGVTFAEANAKAAHKSESEMQAQIQQYCDLQGWPCYRSRMDKRSTGRVGTPDLLICVPIMDRGMRTGMFVGIECKMKGNKPTAEQTHELSKITNAGGAVLVAYSAQEAIDFLKTL